MVGWVLYSQKPKRVKSELAKICQSWESLKEPIGSDHMLSALHLVLAGHPVLALYWELFWLLQQVRVPSVMALVY